MTVMGSAHRAELVELECVAVAPGPSLPEDNRQTDIECDGCRHHDPNGCENHNEDCGRDDIKSPLHLGVTNEDAFRCWRMESFQSTPRFRLCRLLRIR